MKKMIGKSTDNFKEFRKYNYYYVDKTLLIEELFNKVDKVVLLPRPRRFGKTLNLSMLKHYFDINEDNRELFKGLNIKKRDIFNEHINKYPTIFLTLKEIKGLSWEEIYGDFKFAISKLYEEHSYLLKSDKLSQFNKDIMNKIIIKEASIQDYKNSLYLLSEYMYKHYGKEVIILLDEYDTPVNNLYSDNIYDSIMSFMKVFISSAFKGNQYLFKGVITGILRIAKESIFSGANNITVRTILDKDFSDKFGFTEVEVKDILKYYGMEDRIEEAREWYNGYTFGDSIVYNPFSIVNYVQKKVLETYWLNSGNNSLIDSLLLNSDKSIKDKLEELIKGNSIEEEIEEGIVFSELDNPKHLWSLLLFSGYLKANEGTIGKYLLSIPNKEIKKLYSKIIENYFNKLVVGLLPIMDNIAKSILNDNIEEFRKELQNLLLSNISSYDIGKNKEEVYHIITLFSLLKLEYKNEYEVKSNIESGNGRYDICIIPRNINKIGYIIELKVAKDKEYLKNKADEAIRQIEENKYYIELVKKGITNIKLLGVAFESKAVFIIDKKFNFQMLNQ